jgi:hypothetical protein
MDNSEWAVYVFFYKIVRIKEINEVIKKKAYFCRILQLINIRIFPTEKSDDIRYFIFVKLLFCRVAFLFLNYLAGCIVIMQLL